MLIHFDTNSSPSHDLNLPECCCYRKACNIGDFQSIFYVMKESMSPPHVLDINWNLENFTGNLTAGFLKMPDYVNANLTGYPLILIKKAKDMKRFMNLEPFIPLCELVNEWTNKLPQWGTDPDPQLYLSSFCTLFKPSNTF